MRAFYTYLHCRPDGTPFYVGKGSGGRHREFKCARNLHYRRIVEKHGVANILVYTFPCESESQAFADEVQQIAQLRGDGYALANVCDGGEGPVGRKASPETRARISAAQIGRKMSPATIMKRSASVRGSKRSDETRRRISEALKGKTVSVATRAKLAAAAKGKTPSAETRAKLSMAQRGSTHARGYRHTPEAIAKIAEASRRPRKRV